MGLALVVGTSCEVYGLVELVDGVDYRGAASRLELWSKGLSDWHTRLTRQVVLKRKLCFICREKAWTVNKVASLLSQASLHSLLN